MTYPRAGNIGGGGYMVIHLASRAMPRLAIDYRETAPAADHAATSFLDAQRQGRSGTSRAISALAIGVPGTVAGLALAHAKYGSGKFTLARADRARDRARPRRLSGRGRYRRLAAAHAARAWRAGRRRRRSSSRPTAGARAGRPAGAARPRRHARGHRPRRARGVLRRRDRRQHRRRDARRRRHR